MNTETTGTSKVAIVGAGFVGSTFAYALMISGVASEIVVIDKNQEKAAGEVMDLNHGVPFVRPVAIHAGDFSDCAGADIVVITAGAAQKPGETRLDLVRRNAAIFRELIPRITRYTSDAILLVVTNPVDIMTYLTVQISGFPASKVIGSGTVLDTARFRYLLSRYCNVDPKNVHAYVIGEHGDSEVPVWSVANIAGIRLGQFCAICGRSCNEVMRQEITGQLKDAAYEIIERKGATYFAVGLAILEIVESILRHENSVLTVSTLVRDYLGVSDVCLSVPALLNRTGVAKMLRLDLDADEAAQFGRSAKVLKGVLKDVVAEVPIPV